MSSNRSGNGSETEAEREARRARMRDLGKRGGKRSGEARRRKREQPAAKAELSDREQALAALRRALDGNNMAAMVAASKALLDMPETRGEGALLDRLAAAQAELNAKHESRASLESLCPTCTEKAAQLERVIAKRQRERRCPGCGDALPTGGSGAG